MSSYVVTGISTDVGKTVVSAVLCQALGYAYWKPIQSGGLDTSDSRQVALLSPATQIYPEAYRLALPISPHAAAAAEDQRIDFSRLQPPRGDHLIVEGAGGLMVPLNDQQLFADLLEQWSLPVIVVSKHYLGSINHTLLTCALLRARGLQVSGIVFVGPSQSSTERAIADFSSVRILGRLPWATPLDNKWIETQASEGWWHELK